MLDERGSVVLTIVFVITLIVSGFLINTLSFVVSGVDQAVKSYTNPTNLNKISGVYEFLTYSWVYLLPIIIIIGTISYYLSRLQKKNYEVY